MTIVAFGTQYRLHRLLLDRSPFFSTCFNGGPWAESNSSEIVLSPETTDPNMTQNAFELALGRLYGHVNSEEEDKHALPLMAAASYLELQDLAESCVASLLKSLQTSNIADIIRFVTNSYYGPLTDRLLESAKSLLYRDGWEMPFSEWDGISADFVAEIVGYEGFYVPTEYARYCFIRDIIDWRLQQSYCPESSNADEHLKLPPNVHQDDGLDVQSVDDDYAEVRPLRDVLETGIYYVHMTFEELQKIAEDNDVLGRPAVDESVIRDALWQQMVLRQKVLNSPNDSPELSITKTEYISPHGIKSKSPVRSPTPGDTKITGSDSTVSTPRSSLFDLFERSKTSRKYYIPTEDSTTVIGDSPEQTPPQLLPSRGPRATSGPGEVPATLERPPSSDGKEVDTLPACEELRYSEFPPFRFSVEFRSIRTLKEKKRVYSKTVFYAGSYWNIYIQKVKSTKNIQLGVYLHRAKDREGSGSSSSASRETIELGQIVDDARRGGGRSADLEEGEVTMTTTLSGDLTSTSSYRPGANTSATRSLPSCAPSVPEVSVPAMGHYVDSRPMIQTYFKIFSPSRKGKMLSMFSSGPDSFNFSQSWGWKSSSLILEEGALGGSGEGMEDAKVRFMVVLGGSFPFYPPFSAAWY